MFPEYKKTKMDSKEAKRAAAENILNREVVLAKIPGGPDPTPEVEFLDGNRVISGPTDLSALSLEASQVAAAALQTPAAGTPLPASAAAPLQTTAASGAPNAAADPQLLTTPRTPRSYRNLYEHTLRTKTDLSPSVARVLRGGLIQAEASAMKEHLLQELDDRHNRKRHAKSILRPKSWPQSFGLLYVRDAKRQLDKKKAKACQKFWAEQKKKRQIDRTLGLPQVDVSDDSGSDSRDTSDQQETIDDLYFVDTTGDKGKARRK
ncbi:hypothetical protein VTO42DRAFT_4118 [Malbranchea cinnamomea]